MENSRQFYIDGAWVDPIEANDFAVENPATGEVVDTISLGSAADVDLAVAAARAAAEGVRCGNDIAITMGGSHRRLAADD